MNCTYCGKEKKMTREHIIPDGFIRGMNIKEQVRWTRSAPIRVVGSDFVIKDVCGDCNGGELSKLDSYSLNLIKKYNSKISKDSKKVILKYDYDKLTRWLLKVSFNSSRAAKNKYAIKLYKNYIDYIMGRKQNLNNISIHMAFQGLQYEGVDCKFHHLEKDSEVFIDHFRINQMAIKNFQTHKSISKQIMINSFVFIVTVYDDVSNDYVERLEEKIQEMPYKYEKLSSSGRIKLVKDNNIFINSLISSASLQKTFPERKEIEDDSYKIMQIEKSELEIYDYSKIRQFLFDYMIDKDSVEVNYQKLIISISGFDDDPRELFEIESFRAYVKGMLEHYPEIIWFLNVDTKFQFIIPYFLGCCYSNRIGNQVNLHHESKMQFIMTSFDAINRITNDYVIDKSANDDFTKKLMESLQSFLETGESVNSFE